MAVNKEDLLKEIEGSKEQKRQALLAEISGQGQPRAEEQPPREPTGILTSPTKFTEELAKGYKRGIVPAAEMLATGMTAGASEIASGFAGLIAYGLSGGDMDHAAKRTRAWQDVMYKPRSEDAQTIMHNIAPALSEADIKITNFAEDKANGDPVTATAIKTALLGGADVLAAIFPLAKPIKDLGKLRALQNKVMRDAQRLGINLKASDFTDDVIRAAKEQGSPVRGAGSFEYIKALREAEYMAMLKKNSKYMEAYDKKLGVNTSMMQNIGKELLNEDNPNSLAFRFDIMGDDMKKVREALDGLSSKHFSTPNKIVAYKRIESYRQQLNKKINSSKSSEKAALIQIKQSLDGRLNSEFNKAMFNQGESAFSGSPEAFEVFNDARQLAKEHAWFSDTKVIADMIKQDTTPEQFSTWLVGASASGAKKQAAAVVKKMKGLLGEDHPAIEAVRADFVFEVMAPLLKRDPSIKMFLNRYDVMIRNNHSLVKELGLTGSDINLLHKFAQTAEHLPPGGKFYSLGEFIQATSQFTVGHGVAKGAARVKFMTKTLRYLTGEEAITPKEIVRNLTDHYSAEPIIPSNSQVAAGVNAAAAISGMTDEN